MKINMDLNGIFLFLLMVFLHIVDDYYLQGPLAQMKQKKWWRDHPEYDDMYKYDYIAALICHGFSWSFTVHIPFAIMYFTNILSTANNISKQQDLIFLIIFQAIGHSFIDNMKANDRTINLIQDQAVHMLQLIVSFMVMMYL